jgi:hypothetical protein
MAGNRVTVAPKTGGGWAVSARDETYPTQAAAEAVAKTDLISIGGGELLIKGEDGRVREQNTIGRPDPRSSKG